MNAARLYGRYLMVSLRGQMQYRASFLLMGLGQFLLTGAEFLGVWALFERFGSLRGWALGQVAIFYGFINMIFAVADALSTGFDQFGQMVRTGGFDRLLLRPRTAVLQLAGQEVPIRRVGRLLQGALVFGFGVATTDIAWGPAPVMLLLWAAIGGIALFYALIIVQATIAFWTIESLELMNTLTYGGVETASYPISIYHDVFRRFFTFVVPLACVSYLPLVEVMGADDPLGSTSLARWLAPAAGLVFFVAALGAWRFGVRHYTSTGS